MKKILYLMLPALVLISCSSSKPKENKAEAGEEAIWSLSEIWRTDTLMSTSESVLYNPEQDLLYVSCINGIPSEKNGTGFIARLNVDGSINELHWASGLDAPKGMGLHEGKLWVTDIDRLVVIDLENPESREFIPVEGTSFLNDLSIDEDGTVYFTCSDSGRLMRYSGGNITDLISEGLKRPNGVFVEKDRLLMSCSGSSELMEVDKNTGEHRILVNEIGNGDGVEHTGTSGHYLVSSWKGEVFIIMPDYSKQSLLKTSDQQINSADLGFNLKKQVVYVPTFFDNRVVAYQLSKN